MVVLAGSERSVLFGYKEEERGLWRLGRGYPPVFEVFLNKGFADF